MLRPVRLLTIVVGVAALALGACADRPRRASSGPAMRVVTMTPSSTELVAAAGGLARLVGVDRYSIYPAEVDALPEVGDFLAPDLEAILALDPDLVVLDLVQRKTADKLAAARVPTLTLDVHRLADVEVGLRRVGAALGTAAEAERAIAAIDRAVADVRQRAAGHPARVRTLIVVDRQRGGLRGMVAAGPGSYLDELVTLAGGDNVMKVTGVRYPRVSADRVVEAAPTVILDATHAADLDAWREIARVPAVAAGRVHAVGDPVFMAPSPRVGQALTTIEARLFPSP